MSIIRTVTFSLLVLFLVAPNATAQHIHNKHPTSLHAKVWKRTSLTVGPTTPVVAAGPSVWVALVDHTETNDDCQPDTVTIDVTKTVTHTVTVGGGVTLGGSVEAAAGALFAKVAVTASASVTVNGSFSDTTTESVKISTKKTLQPCDIKNYTFKKLKKTATGSISTYDHKIVCTHTRTNRKAFNYCNKKTLTGSGVGWGTTDGKWTNKGKVVPCPCDEVDVEPGGEIEPIAVDGDR